MSRENVEQLRSSNEAIRALMRREFDPEATISKLAEDWDPEIELDASEVPVLDISGVYRGPDAARQWWREWFAAWETLQFEYELIDAGDRVVMLLDLRMRGRSTGIEVPFGKIAWVVTFRGGLVVHLKLYMNQSEALHAVEPVASANVELVRSIYGAWERGDFSAAEWAHPEIEYVITDGPSPGNWSGLAGLAEGARSWISAWQGFRVEPDEFRELDNERVLVLSHGSGRGRTSGLEVGQIAAKAADLFHLRDGKVTRLVVYFDRERALADLGLPPEKGSPRS